MEYKDYYQILGVDKQATDKDIKKAYRKLATEFHPDKNPDNPAAEEKFKEITEAYEVLSDPGKRKKYEQLGANWEAFQQSGFDPNQYRRGGSRTYTFRGDPSDFFRAFFEGSDGEDPFDIFMHQRGGGSRARAAYPGQDIQAEMDISLEEAYRGGSRTFTINGQQLRIRIKPGAYDGQKLRLKGKGNPGINGGPAGDLYIILRLAPDSRFQREGNNLIYEQEVNLYTALLGGQINIPTLSGTVSMHIPEVTAPDALLRLKGKGMPRYERPNEHGDLLVRVKVKFPEKLSDAERKSLEALQKGENANV